MSARRHRLTVTALALALSVAAPLAAAPIDRLTDVPDGAQVIDIRPEAACVEASLPGARCLPADWLFAAEGGPIDFGALRWLLGTLGLNGEETVAVYPADAPDAAAAAALIYLAGQQRVALVAGTAPTGAGGETRSFSREAVFVSPMRLGALTAADTPPDTPLTTRLAAFAAGQKDTVAFGPAE